MQLVSQKQVRESGIGRFVSKLLGEKYVFPLYMGLGQQDAADLRAPLRASNDPAVLCAAIDEAISRKPKGHDFVIDRQTRKPAVSRHMSVTGG